MRKRVREQKMKDIREERYGKKKEGKRRIKIAHPVHETAANNDV